MKRTLCSAALASVALALAPTPARSEKNYADHIEPDVRRWLGKRAVDVIANADRGEIVRVDPKKLDAARGKTPPNVGGYPIVGETHALDARLLDGFQDTLLDRRTHDIPPPMVGYGKLCGPIQPGVALRLWAKDDKTRRAPLEILLCFACNDLLVVAPHSRPQSMSPGAADLLRLAAAGLPDFTELAQMLATRTQKSAREELFEALLPADVQIALRSDALVKGAYADPGALLHARFPGRELVGLAARAFAVLDRSWDRSDKRTEMLVEAVKKLAPADKLAGLEAIRGDQVALAGAAELFYRGAFKDLKPEQRHGWGPAVVEAALIQQANVDRCSLVQAVTTAGAKSVPLLLRVRRDEIAFPRRTQPNFWRLDRDPSPAACAMLALLEADKAKAAEELRAWRPSGPLDTAVARVARARLGDGDVADPALFKLESIVVAVAALDAYRARPSAGAIDVIVQEGVGHQFGPVRDKAAKVFAALTGVVLEAPAADDRAKAAQTWWQEHRAAWRPPAGAAR